MVIDTNGDFIESVENMGPQMRGIVKVVKIAGSTSFGFITPETGKDIFFNSFSLKSFDSSDKSREKIDALVEEFKNFPEGTKVKFNVVDAPRGRGPMACNLEVDTSEETSVLVPKTENAVAEILADSPECSLEDEVFRVDSTDWNETAVEDSKGNSIVIKTNHGKDICELPGWVQLFTPNAMARELILSGREQDMMTGEQAQWLLKNTPNNIPEGCEFAGFIDSKERLLFNGENACYWIGDVTEKGNQKALFCIDIDKVDEEMRPYTDEMIISDYDMKSMMQVRLLKKKTA